MVIHIYLDNIYYTLSLPNKQVADSDIPMYTHLDLQAEDPMFEPRNANLDFFLSICRLKLTMTRLID